MDNFQLDPDEICIQRAHRIGRLRKSRPKQIIHHRPLIAAFRDYQDCELILSHASRLQGTNKGISRDYPQEIIKARKPLRAEMKALKQSQPEAKISIQYPAKLVIDGRVHMDMFPQWREYMKRDRLKTGTTDDGSSCSDHEEAMDQSAIFTDTESQHAATAHDKSANVVGPPTTLNQLNTGESSAPKDIPAPSLFGSIRQKPTDGSQTGSPRVGDIITRDSTLMNEATVRSPASVSETEDKAPVSENEVTDRPPGPADTGTQ